MKLAYKKLGSGMPVVILHGLFGMSDNWISIGKKLAEQFTVYLLDQRNHGRSPHSSEFNYQVLADDLALFLDEHNLLKVSLLGHSMGGKTVLVFSELYPDKIEKMIIADIALRSYNHPYFLQFIQALKSIDIKNLKRRQEADQILSRTVSYSSVRQFLLKNLYRDDNHHFRWRVNLESIHENLDKIMGAYTGKKPYNGPILFLRGEKSDYINKDDIIQIESTFSNAQVITIANASHWIHADAPEDFISAVISFLLL